MFISFQTAASVVINEIHYAPPDKTQLLEFIEIYNRGESETDLAGWRLSGAVRFEFPPGSVIGPSDYLVLAENPSAIREVWDTDALGPFDGILSNEGERLVLSNSDDEIVDEVAYRPEFPWPVAADGEGSSMELIHPALDNSLGGNWRSSGNIERPVGTVVNRNPSISLSATPGAVNSVFDENAPPAIEEAAHFPEAPWGGTPVQITAKAFDPDGVGRVGLAYQIVPPGEYLPAYLPLSHAALLFTPETPLQPNPAFEAPSNWTRVLMNDAGLNGDIEAGDGIFTGAIPPQPHRTLVRYRILAADRADPPNSVTVPHPDDPSLNFAYFVYDGVPGYYPTRRSVREDGLTNGYSAEIMRSLPAYHLITRSNDFFRCQAYAPVYRIPKENFAARKKFNWEGAFVCEGVVYDHIFYRLRQANDRYNGSLGGKRSMRIDFHKGRRFQARDRQGRPYPSRWKKLNLGKMFDTLKVQNFGITESLNSILWNLVAVPAPWTHSVQLRVIDDSLEAPAGGDGQYHGDFWGMFLAIEDFDSGFIESHGLKDGNLYKLKEGYYDNGNPLKRAQGRYSVKDDGDFQFILNELNPAQSQDWLRRHVDYDMWYRYHAVNEAVRHYDYHLYTLKNRAWYFEPVPNLPLGRLQVLPWDSDATWGPSWGEGLDLPKNALFSGDDKMEMKIEYRNFIREFLDLVWRSDVVNREIDALAERIESIADADRDRWIEAPFGDPIPYGPLKDKVTDMKYFAFKGWTGWTGPAVPRGGRAAHLERLAGAEGDAERIPATPEIRYIGEDAYPPSGLRFETTAFADPQGPETFGAMQWRLAEVDHPNAARRDSNARALFEWNAVWTSGVLDDFDSQITLPPRSALSGHAYRVRVRMRDHSNRWSHWSQPIEFIAGPSEYLKSPRSDLAITEIMYHPAHNAELEFIELTNIGESPLSLGAFRFAEGIRFDFADSEISTLESGASLILVRNKPQFLLAFPQRAKSIAGEYEGSLANEGEYLALFGPGPDPAVAFEYDDDWHPSTDGEGASLALKDPFAASVSPNHREAWKANPIRSGTPGTIAQAGDSDGDGLPNAWELAHWLDPWSPGEAFEDHDRDGYNALEELRCGTNPRNGASRLTPLIVHQGSKITVEFRGMTAKPDIFPGKKRVYQLEQRTWDQAAWSTVGPEWTGNGEWIQFSFSRARLPSTTFYRVKVQLTETEE